MNTTMSEMCENTDSGRISQLKNHVEKWKRCQFCKKKKNKKKAYLYICREKVGFRIMYVNFCICQSEQTDINLITHKRT